MIFIAYNFFKYRVNTKKNMEFKEFVIDKITKNFQNERYILPYSQYTRLELAKKLECEDFRISGSFLDDLEFIMSKCDKLVFFPTDSFFIGSGVYLEIACAKKFKIPIYGYNKDKNEFSQNFQIKTSEFVESYNLNNIFNKKIKFL
jgi:hypothetical protein